MALRLSMHLPDALLKRQDDLALALTTSLQTVWDPDRTYENAHQPMAIGKVLVDAVHEELAGASIAYLFREKMKTRDRVVWGRASKAGAKLEFFADHDFVIEFNWSQWRQLAPMQRIALVDHELSHFGREEDDKGNRSWVLVSHDIEEFTGIVHRWGLRRSDLMVFAGAVVHAHQLGLFENAHD